MLDLIFMPGLWLGPELGNVLFISFVVINIYFYCRLRFSRAACGVRVSAARPLTSTLTSARTTTAGQWPPRAWWGPEAHRSTASPPSSRRGTCSASATITSSSTFTVTARTWTRQSSGSKELSSLFFTVRFINVIYNIGIIVHHYTMYRKHFPVSTHQSSVHT